ncbi:hypothetical protein T261_8568 [Streptomyces lydicus]|nr:hypothetical protein T261_8568 [Streptomyces lydicus]
MLVPSDHTDGGGHGPCQTLPAQHLLPVHPPRRARIRPGRQATSHSWARAVPGVTYCRNIAWIHDALIRLAQEGRCRIRLTEQLVL